MEFILAETGRGFSGEFEYDTSLFDPATIQRLAGYWQQLLDGICADPDQRLSQLPGPM
jgi:non-ribosomal peptide synthetase component F